MSLPVLNLTNLNGSNGFRLDGEETSYMTGYSVSDAGDINGDGFDDLIICDRGNFSYVVFGKDSGFDAQIDLSSLDGGNGFRVNGHSDGWGSAVASAGDIDGDGFDDVMVRAVFYEPNKYSLHAFYNTDYVVFGKESGFEAHEYAGFIWYFDRDVLNNYPENVDGAGDINGDGFDDLIIGSVGRDSSFVLFGKEFPRFHEVVNLQSIDGNEGFRLDGFASDDRFGYAVSSLGDVNGDGFDDVIIGAPDADCENSGCSYVIFGKASGFGTSMSLSELDGSNGFRLNGVTANDSSGSSVSGAGDVNGDGFDDLIIGAPGVDSNSENSGSSYVIFGKASGFDATIDLSSLDGSNGFCLNGESANDFLGRRVSGVGDVNGDGFDDVIVTTGIDSGSGISYVIFGKPSGFVARENLSDLDVGDGFRIDGEHAGDLTGYSVSGAGDFNGDGFDDLVIGAPYNRNSGSSYVIFGSSDFDQDDGLPEIKGAEGDDVLSGSEIGEHFISGGGNDNLLGRGGADVFDAGAGDDAIRIGDLTFDSINGGTGNDSLHLTGSDMNLDFTTLGDRIHNIETICLYGRGDNTLALTSETVLSLSDSTDILKVHGNSGDHIVVQDNGWVDGGSQGFYHTYTHDDAVLLVGTNVTVELV